MTGRDGAARGYRRRRLSRATPIDQFTHLDMRWNDGQMRIVLTFDGRLDEHRLEKALRLSIEQEPLLARRFEPRAWRPVWAPMDRPLASPAVEVLRDRSAGGGDTHDPEISPGVAAYLVAPMDFYRGPQVHVAVVRSEVDRLCVKMSHGVGDGAGVLAYVDRLAALYRGLGTRRPVPIVRGGYRPRRSFPAVWDGDLRTLARSIGRFRYPRPVATFPLVSDDMSGTSWAVRQIDPARVVRLATYGRERGVSVGSLLLGAYYHALFTVVPGLPDVPVPVVVSVDLRRHLPPGTDWGIRPLAGWIFVEQDRYRRPYDERVRNVHAQIGAGLGSRDDLARILFFETVAALGFAPVHGVYEAVQRWARGAFGPVPYVANFGRLGDDRFDFGGPSTTAVAVCGMAYAVPGVGLTASTFRGTLTVTAAFRHTAVDPELVRAFMDTLVGTLPA